MTNNQTTRKPRLRKVLAGIALAGVLTGGATAVTATPPAAAGESFGFVEAKDTSKAAKTSPTSSTSSFGFSFQSWGVSWQ